MTLEQLKTLLKKLRIRKNTELFKNTYILKYNIFIIIYLHPWEDLLCILPQELLIDVHLEARGLSELSFFFSLERQFWLLSGLLPFLSVCSVVVLLHLVFFFFLLTPPFRMSRCCKKKSAAVQYNCSFHTDSRDRKSVV